MNTESECKIGTLSKVDYATNFTIVIIGTKRRSYIT